VSPASPRTKYTFVLFLPKSCRTNYTSLAMAELANAEMWHDLPSGPAHAQEAVRLARACRSAKALAYALAAKVMAGVFTDGSGDIRDAEEAQAAAAQAHDVRAFMVATVWAGNCLDCSASRAVLERWQSGREKLVSMGAPHVYIAWLSANEAVGLLQLGDWRGCEERLRNVLGSTPGPQRAAQACADAHLVWDEAYTWWRATEALAKDRTARDAAAALRRAHELAVDLQAAPLLADVEALAQSTRISLATVDEAPPAETATLPGIPPANGRSSPTSWRGAPTARSPASWCSARRRSACTSPTCCTRPAPPIASSWPSWPAGWPARARLTSESPTECHWVPCREASRARGGTRISSVNHKPEDFRT
jgi:hypothetical protein